MVHDAHGNELRDSDTVTVLEDLKVKGTSSVVKVGTCGKRIRLVDGQGGHDMDRRIEGCGALQLESEFVKKSCVRCPAARPAWQQAAVDPSAFSASAIMGSVSRVPRCEEGAVAVTHPVARTAFYCCAVRADDAARAMPICGDGFAARFVDPAIRLELAPLLSHWAAAAANVARHRLIDDLIRERLVADREARVVIIGAGFDTRAFRLPGGRWFEIDDAALLDFKEQRLPAATAPRPLQRLAVDFERTPALEYLGTVAGRDRALIVVEGVSMYLDDATLGRLVVALRSRLPRATLVCDLMTARFRWFDRSLEWALAHFGAHLAERGQHPRAIVEAAGYRQQRLLSIVGRAREAHTLYIPAWLFDYLLRELRDGYAVYLFEPVERRRRARSRPATGRASAVDERRGLGSSRS